MSGFTQQEREAELKRRQQVDLEKCRERERLSRIAETQQADTVCIICHQPFRSYTSSGGAHSICDTCF